MQEDRLSDQQSLEIIESMINKAKNQFSENGHLYLLWGWAVFICSIVQFVLLYFYQYEYHYVVWASLWLLVGYQIFYLRKVGKIRKVKTYTDDIIGYVWLVFVLMMFLFGVLYGRVLGNEYYKFINPGFLALYGMPTFLSGIILRFRPLVIGGIACWVLSVVSTFVDERFQLLLLSAAMVIAWIIPGYIMKDKYKKQLADYGR
jgi:hypothetical protein